MEEHCRICDVGLSVCGVCGFTEGGLPTHCPGVKVDYDTEDLISHRRLDYINGAWVLKEV